MTRHAPRAAALVAASALAATLVTGCAAVSDADRAAHTTITTILAETRQDGPDPFTLTDQDRAAMAGLWNRRANRMLQTEPDNTDLATARNMFAAAFRARAAYYRGDREALERAAKFSGWAWDGMSLYETGEPRLRRAPWDDSGLMPGDDLEPNDEYPYGPGT